MNKKLTLGVIFQDNENPTYKVHVHNVLQSLDNSFFFFLDNKLF